MTYKAFASAMKVSTKRDRGSLPLLRDESLERQRRRKEKELAEQKIWNERWQKEQEHE